MEHISNSYTVQSVISRTKYHLLYLVKDNVTNRFYVIKTLNDTWQRDDNARDFLRNQALTEKKLKHAHICETLDCFDRDNGIYVLREYLQGSDLRLLLEKVSAPISADKVSTWLKQMLNALVYAHALGIYHGHINPDSIFILDDGAIKLHGFAQAQNAWLRADLGKPQYHPVHYIAPEIYEGERCLALSDAYSIAVIGYQLLTGRLPWHLDPNLAPLQQKPVSFTRPVLNPDLIGAKVPLWLYTILNKALAVDPAMRFPSCGHMLKAMEGETDVGYQPPQQKIKPKPVITEPEPLLETETVINPELLPDPADVPMEKPSPIIEGIDIPIDREEVDQHTDIQSDDEPSPNGQRSIIKDKPAAREPEVKIDQEPAPTPVRDIPPVRESKPQTKPEKITITIGADDTEQEISRMKKMFLILMILSLAILVFVAFRYFVSRPDNQHTIKDQVSTDAQDLRQKLLPNELIPMVFVEGDTAVVGSISPDAEADEFPMRQSVLRSFYIGKFEITQREWQMVFENNPSRFKDDIHPVENVSFYDAVEFCNQKSLLDGFMPFYEIRDDEIIYNFDANGYRLPTEVEWEFAAKSGKLYVDETFSGSNDPDQVGWYNLNSKAATNPVGRLNPNQLGIHDMSGNVYEWIWNWYACYSVSTHNFYSGPESGTDKVIRGGSWYHDKSNMRITARNYGKPYTKTNYIGFRVVRNAE